MLREGKKKTISLKPTYRKIGITDGCEASQFSNNPFSLANKQIKIQRSSSLLKVSSIRNYYSQILQISPKNKNEDPDDRDSSLHPFTTENYNNQISLSVYNTP